jgi:hypothetical protein
MLCVGLMLGASLLSALGLAVAQLFAHRFGNRRDLWMVAVCLLPLAACSEAPHPNASKPVGSVGNLGYQVNRMIDSTMGVACYSMGSHTLSCVRVRP